MEKDRSECGREVRKRKEESKDKGDERGVEMLRGGGEDGHYVV